MPKSVIKFYLAWIKGFPESWHPDDLMRFYVFVHVLLAYSRKPRSRFWLQDNIEKDCPKLSKKDIKDYGELYEHLRNYSNVGKRY